jgi:hypothetical protein
LGLPGKVVEEVMEENHGDDTLSPGSLLGVLQLSSSESDPSCKGAAHATGGDLIPISVMIL